jgi:hypothetical protein
MARTALIYEAHTAEETAAIKNLMLILGAGRYFKPAEFSGDLRETYDFYFIGGPVNGGQPDAAIAGFVTANADWLKAKRVVLFGLGAPGAVTPGSFKAMSEALGAAVIATEAVVLLPGEAGLMALTEVGLSVKELRDAGDVKLPPAEIKKHVEDFLKGHKYCILCTGAGDRVRGTAVSYKYHEGHIYIVAEGAAKFANLIVNDNVSIALHAPYLKGERHAGIQVSGKATVLDPASDAYREMMRIRGSDYERLTQLPWILWGLDVKLERAEFWWAEWRNLGVSPKQTYNFD